jgi:hypothetical protein
MNREGPIGGRDYLSATATSPATSTRCAAHPWPLAFRSLAPGVQGLPGGSAVLVGLRNQLVGDVNMKMLEMRDRPITAGSSSKQCLDGAR